eukprot:1110772_1
MPNMVKSKSNNADIQKQNGLAQLQHNWNTRKPYSHSKASRKSTKTLRKTEFKLLLNEAQMTQCYDPVKLYEINKQLMVRTIGTCRVEGLKLIVSVPNGRKDLTEGIQIIEKIIGPVQYLDDQTQDIRTRNAANHFNTMHLTMSPNAFRHQASDTMNTTIIHDEAMSGIYTSLPAPVIRQRGTSMLSNQIGNASDSPRAKLSEQFVIQKRKQMRRYSENYVDCLKKQSVLQTVMIVDEYDSDDGDEYKTTATDINMEQEWDDFDDIMTEDSIGMRRQAQLLMERKLKLKEQQKAIEARIKQQQNEEEYKSQEQTIGHEATDTVITTIVHQPMSINTRFNTDDIPDLPHTMSSTRDELYDSYKPRSGSRESEVLRSLRTLSHDIDEELRGIDDKILSTDNNAKQSQVFSRGSASILPFHRSQPQNERLLQIIHTIQNMPKPVVPRTDYSQSNDRNLISLVIREFAHAFRTTEDEDRRGSEETVPDPRSVDDELPPLMAHNDEDVFHHIPKKRSVRYTLKQVNLDDTLEDEYCEMQYLKSALFDDGESNDVMRSLLAQSDLLSEIIFYKIASVVKHFAFVLKIVDSLSFGLQHQRERVVATMLKKVSAMKQTDYLQQKLLFLYWSLLDEDGVNHKDSDFYLYNEYRDLILYGLSAIIYASNDEDNKPNFVVESSKCWKRIISHLVHVGSEVVLDCLEDLSSFNIPSKVFFPSMNMKSQLKIDYFKYEQIYQYKNCNVCDILCHGYHSNKKIKLKSPFLIRIGIDCVASQQMQYVYELMNCMWRPIHNKILFLQCQSIAKNIGVWCLRAHLIHMHSVSKWNVINSHHFIVSSATIFVASYIMGLDWNEVLQTCFVCLEYGDVYQLSPLSILFDCASERPFNQMLHDDHMRDNVFLLYIFKCLQLIDSTNKNSLWQQWLLHVKRLFNIIVFNINESSFNKDKKHYFDHSHLFQIIQLTKMLFAKQIKMHRITNHFSNLLNAQL